ncbi:hypothetical protein Pst134EA_015102 [Puccinia striiformis f. sp. tritici]|uniref:hypothetical protein n=1 Tax=Puccinia striiformis f. sp. tritici TaxID=168172 RepID=UPI0020083E34|nr:hypothetical protein Pst134EA_015102 [Puccinia striiformis f. sp. tritici]KAH9463015.1 hypothetical protein Pst134EA_015102 [Puccinia striiformis f. sp. tritici]
MIRSRNSRAQLDIIASLKVAHEEALNVQQIAAKEALKVQRIAAEDALNAQWIAAKDALNVQWIAAEALRAGREETGSKSRQS